MNGRIERSRTGSGTKSRKPISDGWISLGSLKGIKWTLWHNNVTFQRREKEGDKWLTTEELHAAKRVLKEIFWRVPGWLAKIEKKRGGKSG